MPMVVDLPCAEFAESSMLRALKAREFVPYPASGTAPCRAPRASGAATIHPANPRAARRLRR